MGVRAGFLPPRGLALLVGLGAGHPPAAGGVTTATVEGGPEVAEVGGQRWCLCGMLGPSPFQARRRSAPRFFLSACVCGPPFLTEVTVRETEAWEPLGSLADRTSGSAEGEALGRRPRGALGGEGVALGHRLSPNVPLPCGSEGSGCQLSLRLSFPIFETSFLGSSFGHFGEGTRGIMAFALGWKGT